MKIKFALLILFSVSLSGCLTWDVNQQAVANAAAAGAAAAVTEAVIDAVADENDEDESSSEEARAGYVPDPNDPLNGPNISQSI